MAKVAGVITLDGQPLEGAKLFFSPIGSSDRPYPGPRSTGKTNAEGRFRLTTKDGYDGAVVGKHRVRITTLLETVDPNNSIKVLTVTPEKIPFKYKRGGRLDTEVPQEGLAGLRFDLKS